MSLRRFALKVLGFTIFSPLLKATKLVTPKSTPISLEHGGNGSISVSTSKEIDHLPAGESFTVIVDGLAPLGSSRLQRIASGSPPLARNTCPSFHLNADLVNSALPPLRFFLKVGYFARPAKKLLKAVCRCLNPCCKGTELTSDRKSKSSCFFHARQHRRAFNVTDSFAFTVPGFCSSSQGTVIDQTSTAHRASQQGFLLSRAIETVLESSLRHILHYSNYSVRYADFNVKPC